MSSLSQWIPFDLACRLNCLQQGTLNVGNTRQNKANLLTLALAQIFAPSSPPWAKYSGAVNEPKKILIYPTRVPGFVGPIGTGIPSNTGTPDYQPSFPRLGVYSIGSPQSYQLAATQNWFMTKHIIIHNTWNGFQLDGHTANAVWQPTVRNGSLVGRQLFLAYEEILECDKTSNTVATLRTAATSGNWLLRDVYPAGTLQNGFEGSNFNMLTLTPGSTLVNGLEAAQWREAFGADYVYAGNALGFADRTNTANPGQDGGYTDNLFGRLPQAGDWNRDGVNDATLNDATLSQSFRNGNNLYFTARRSRYPQKYMFANLANGFDSAHRTELMGSAAPNGYKNVFDGGILEHHIGLSGSTAESSGLSEMITRYNFAEDNCRGIKAVIICSDNVTTTGGDDRVATNWLAMRYGLAYTLVFGNGYYFPNASTAYSQTTDRALVFDEFSGGALNSYGYLGTATEARKTFAQTYSNGVYLRQFTGGMAVFNPRGNGAQTITLPRQMRKLTGSQDAVTNDGSLVTSVTLADRDGLILINV